VDTTREPASRTVGCFIRVDVGVPGEHTSDAYEALSQRLQHLLQEAILERADGGPEMDLQSMSCLVLGPLGADETIAETLSAEEHFQPVAEWLSTGFARP
jgi:hypothetical protein